MSIGNSAFFILNIGDNHNKTSKIDNKANILDF